MSALLYERLLAHLKTKTNDLGQALGRDDVLMEELSCTAPELMKALEQLERAGSLTVLTPLPFLAVKMKTWPNTPPIAPETAPTAYSYPLSQSRLNRISYRPQAGGADLLHEILDTLGETDPAGFEKAAEPKAFARAARPSSAICFPGWPARAKRPPNFTILCPTWNPSR